MGALGAMQAQILMQRNHVAQFYRENVSFIRKTAKKRF